jgi:hypothetical protein
MSNKQPEQRKTLFLDPHLGWTENETPQAEYKLDCLRRVTISGIVENTLMRKQTRETGQFVGWQPLNPSDLVELSGDKQGYQFQVKPRQGKQGQFLEVHSARFVDPDMWKEILQGIPLYDLDLKEVPNVSAIINSFCIPVTHVAEFQQRVAAKRGVILEGQADLQIMYSQMERVTQIAKDMESLCSQSRAIVENIANTGVQTAATEIDARNNQASMLREEAARLVGELEDGRLAVEQGMGRTEAEAHAEAYVDHAKAQLDIVEQLHREHTSYKIQAKLLTKNTISQSLPGFAEGATVARRYLLMPVVEYYTELGFDFRMIENGMIIKIGDTIVELSDKPIIRKAGGEAGSADQMLGKQSGERTQREL